MKRFYGGCGVFSLQERIISKYPLPFKNEFYHKIKFKTIKQKIKQ
ncbi:hypothetical protein HMPREF1430_01330 [Helicobacter pylori GAM96Ai]|nr:hypothetical protein HMPREF1430_01330 [Helicobacter pylori GAM96Ai]